MNYFDLIPMNSSYSVEQTGTQNQVALSFTTRGSRDTNTAQWNVLILGLVQPQK